MPLLPIFSVLDQINERFEHGKPSNNFAEAGVMVTMIDGDLHTVPYNGHPAYPAWVPKVQGRQVNRLSGSLINRGMPGVYGYLPLGLILAPQAAQACLWCAYPFDAGSNGCANTPHAKTESCTHARRCRLQTKSLLSVLPAYGQADAMSQRFIPPKPLQ